MLSEFRKRKLAVAFYRLDATKDGYLTMDDMVLIGQRIAEAEGYAPGSAGYEACVAPYREAWSTLIMPGDTEGKGQITLGEYSDRIDQFGAMPEMKEMAIQMHGLFFDLIDLNKDGKIQDRELILQLGALGIHPEDARISFSKLDTNGDGVVSRQEYAQAIYDHHMSDDPETPGNWVLGPF